MKKTSKVVAAILGVSLFAVISVMVSPRTAHALVATLVQVVNTSANPVPNKDVDNPVRHAFSSECSSFGGGNTTGCSITVESGNELVIQGLTIKVVTDPGASTETTLVAGVNGKYHSYNIGVQDEGPCNI